MYVCVCHALTDGDVRSARDEGAATSAEVFRHYGVKPQCGRCVRTMGGVMGRCGLGCGETAAERRHANDGDAPLAHPRRHER